MISGNATEIEFFKTMHMFVIRFIIVNIAGYDRVLFVDILILYYMKRAMYTYYLNIFFFKSSRYQTNCEIGCV